MLSNQTCTHKRTPSANPYVHVPYIPHPINTHPPHKYTSPHTHLPILENYICLSPYTTIPHIYILLYPPPYLHIPLLSSHPLNPSRHPPTYTTIPYTYASPISPNPHIHIAPPAAIPHTHISPIHTHPPMPPTPCIHPPQTIYADIWPHLTAPMIHSDPLTPQEVPTSTGIWDLEKQ